MYTRRDVIVLTVINGILLAILSGLLFTRPQITASFAALVGVVWLAVTLIPPRILNLTVFGSSHPRLLAVARNGKWLGIWAAIWLTIYGLLSASAYFIDPHLLRPAILGLMCLIIMFGLVCISNKWSYANLKWWKHLSMSIWLALPLAFGHFVLTGSLRSIAVNSVIFGLLFITMLTSIIPFIAGKRDYFARMRVWLLTTGLLIGFLIAVWPS